MLRLISSHCINKQIPNVNAVMSKVRNWGIAKFICVSKVRNFSEIAPNIAFPEFNFYELYYSTFEKSELGRIRSCFLFARWQRTSVW